MMLYVRLVPTHAQSSNFDSYFRKFCTISFRLTPVHVALCTVHILRRVVAKSNYYYKSIFPFENGLRVCSQAEIFCLSICKDGPVKHMPDIFSAGGMKHGTKGMN